MYPEKHILKIYVKRILLFLGVAVLKSQRTNLLRFIRLSTIPRVPLIVVVWCFVYVQVES